MWAGSIEASEVYRIDPATNQVAGVVEVGSAPRDVVVLGRDLWVAEFGGDTVSRYRLAP